MNHVIPVKKKGWIKKKKTGTELDLKYQLGKQPLATQPDIVVVDKEGERAAVMDVAHSGIGKKGA